MNRINLAIGIAIGLASSLAKAELVKIAHIDPFTGPIAALAESSNRGFKHVVTLANKEGWAPGNTFEVVNFDGKGSPQESLLQLRNAIDQGVRYIVHGHSSAVAAALIEAIDRHNERNPGKEVVYLNVTNAAPELTNAKCSFWHFRFESDQDMKAQALAVHLNALTEMRKIYLINQNYSYGQQTATGVRDALKKKAPQIEVVGDDLHPLLTVKDFSPYISKIRAAKAQAIVTANYGVDLTLLIKAAKDAGLDIPIYAFSAATAGVPTALAAANVKNVYHVTYWNPNENLEESGPLIDSYRAKYSDDFVMLPYYTSIRVLSEAMKLSNSVNPIAVAHAMEGIKVKSMNGVVEIRKADHQIQRPLMVNQWIKVEGGNIKYDSERTGYGWKTIQKLKAEDSMLPTTCKMKRPAVAR